jgi:N-acetyl-anhydromuramyl-L-alanine amidase AmpD
MNQRGWGDIGYHYVIDRSGRIWEARPIQYQGAHVASNNENNLGIMVLGNFDKQQPTDAQMATLRQALIRFRKTYNVPVSRVYTHQEITPTACPGRSLQPRMVAMRKGNQLA